MLTKRRQDMPNAVLGCVPTPGFKKKGSIFLPPRELLRDRVGNSLGSITCNHLEVPSLPGLGS